MAISLESRLYWRRKAPFHVQLELEELELEKPQDVRRVAGTVGIQARVIQVFRTDGRLAVGDAVGLSLWACNPGDLLDGEEAFISFDAILAARYMEAYLRGNPPAYEVAGKEFRLILAPSEEPSLTPRELEERLEQLAIDRIGLPAPKWWQWQFWKR